MSDENVSAEEARGLLDGREVLTVAMAGGGFGDERWLRRVAVQDSPLFRRLARTVIALHAELGVVIGENLQMRAERSGHKALRKKAEKERDEARADARRWQALASREANNAAERASETVMGRLALAEAEVLIMRSERDEARRERDRLALIIFGAWSDIEHADCWDDPKDGIKQAHAALWSVVREGRRQKASDAARTGGATDAT